MPVSGWKQRNRLRTHGNRSRIATETAGRSGRSHAGVNPPDARKVAASISNGIRLRVIDPRDRCCSCGCAGIETTVFDGWACAERSTVEEIRERRAMDNGKDDDDTG